PIQYGDYAYWQRNWLQGDVLEQQFKYWGKQLAELPQVHNLPLDYERPQYQSFNGASHAFAVDAQVSGQLKKIALDNNTTMFMLMHAAFTVLLSRFANNTDIIIGTVVANRAQKELESLIGFFVNTLVLRTNTAANPTVLELLQQVKEVNLQAQENQDIPFEHLVDRLQPRRSTSHGALFQIMLSMDTNEETELALPELNITNIKQEMGSALFDLSLNITENQQLFFNFEYNTDLFKLETIKRFARSLQQILTGIAKDSRQNISDLTLLDNSEIHYLQQTLNKTQAAYPSEFCIHQLFEQQVIKTPDNIAVVFAEESLTYQQLNQQANQLAHHLIAQDIKADDVIGLCFQRSTDMLVSMLAILKAGAAYLPLDPSYPRGRLSHMLHDSGLKLLITKKQFSALFEKQGQTQIIVDKAEFIEKLKAYKSSNPQVKELTAKHLAYVIYTSGSTGKPKGVMIEHQALNNLCQWHINAYAVTADKKASHLASIGFDAAVWELWPYLCSGAAIHIISDETRISPKRLLETFNRQHITHAFMPTALLENSFELFDQADTKLEYLLVGGEKLNKNGFVHSKTQLVNHYGPTESTVVASAYVTNPNDIKTPPIGKPIANIRAYVLNRDLSLTPDKSIGELYLAGAGLARGYINQAELTEQSFINHVFSDGEQQRLYKTGDLVRYSTDGNLEFIGRADDQIKIRGFRIELGEIEA
ncbi:MAG TPA: amino acid adenylation domain-containing protein, partial [Oceanospirillales bacterium]|nr:amino acid adenylation domain-containing protein [Oceanospirillales bacterium]